MKLTKQLRMDVKKVLVITIAYILIQIHMAFYNYGAHTSEYSLGPSSLYSLRANLFTGIFLGFVSGILCGVMLVFVNGRYFRRKSFRFALLSTALFYVVIFNIFNFLWAWMTVYSKWGVPDESRSFLSLMYGMMFAEVTISVFAFWGMIILLTLFALQVNDKFGPGMLAKFLKGKYYHPKPEERIFLFADLRSSSAIAEKIGNEHFFQLISEIFADITPSIINHNGEIYQYVGDEIVISWPVENRSNNEKSISCFLEMKRILKEQSNKYMKKYGVVPEIKAGMHHGEVIAGEIGIIKREIAYLGDVLNTTSRIQELCNKFQVDFLISSRTFDLMENKHLYDLVSMGEIELRGKEKKVFVNSIRLREN